MPLPFDGRFPPTARYAGLQAARDHLVTPYNYSDVYSTYPGNDNILTYVSSPTRIAGKLAAKYEVGDVGTQNAERIVHRCANILPYQEIYPAQGNGIYSASTHSMWVGFSIWIPDQSISNHGLAPDQSFVFAQFSKFNDIRLAAPGGNVIYGWNPVNGQPPDRFRMAVCGHGPDGNANTTGATRNYFDLPLAPTLGFPRNKWIDFLIYFYWHWSTGNTKLFWRLEPNTSWTQAFDFTGPNNVTQTTFTPGGTGFDGNASFYHGCYNAERGMPYVVMYDGGAYAATTRAEVETAMWSAAAGPGPASLPLAASTATAAPTLTMSSGTSGYQTPQFVDAGTFASALGTSITPGLPAFQPGDICIAIISQNGDTNTVTAPAGWTKFIEYNNTGFSRRLTLAWRRMQAGDTAGAFTKTGSVTFAGRIVSYRGVGLIGGFTCVGAAADIAGYLLCVSDDNGQTWEIGLPIDTPDGPNANEWDVAELANGDLLGIFRTGDNIGRWKARLIDQGNGTWDWATGLQTTGLPFATHPEIMMTQEGVLLMVSTTGLHWSNDEGVTWTSMSFTPSHSYASNYYPRAVQDASGTIYVFAHVGSDNYYGEVDQSITMDKFNLVVDSTGPTVVHAINYARSTIYHSPQTPGATEWVGASVMPDNSILIAFDQSTGPNVGAVADTNPANRTLMPEDKLNNFGLTYTGRSGFSAMDSRYDRWGLTNITKYLQSTDGGATWVPVLDDPIGPDLFMSSYNPQPLIVLDDGTIVRRVNGDDLRQDNSVSHTAFLQFRSSLLSPWGVANNVVTDPQFCKWQFSRIRKLSDGRLVALGQAWRPGAATIPAVPWDVFPAAATNATSTFASAAGVTTARAQDMVVAFVSTWLASSGTANYSNWTAATATPTERVDNATALGNGTAIGVADAVKQTTGATGTWSASQPNATSEGVLVTLAPELLLNPANIAATGVATGTGSVSVAAATVVAPNAGSASASGTALEISTPKVIAASAAAAGTGGLALQAGSTAPVTIGFAGGAATGSGTVSLGIGSTLLLVGGAGVASGTLTPRAPTVVALNPAVAAAGDSDLLVRTTTDAFTGVLDEVALYNVALDVDTVLDHWYIGRALSTRGAIIVVNGTNPGASPSAVIITPPAVAIVQEN